MNQFRSHRKTMSETGRTEQKKQNHQKNEMKSKILTVATLTLIIDASALVRAGDMKNMPGMNTGGIAQTNNLTGGTNAPIKPYPLDYCLVSGDKLDGDMGKPIVMNYKGQEFKFCCASCPKKFKKDPEKYVKMLQEAEKEKKQKNLTRRS